jgi:mannosyltransferase OCH1-like enzyme
MIPKIIHQTWKNKQIPDEWNHAVESCKKINSHYKYILWTDETMKNFVKKEYPEFYNIYKKYKYDIQRCDAFRYLVLYKYGGIYLDMDIVCLKKLDSFLKYDIVLAKSSNISSSYTNAFFMVKPNHPFIKYCIDMLPEYINSYSYFGKHLHVMNSTGPVFLTNMINKYDLTKITKYYVLTNNEYAGDCNVCNENTCKGGEYFIQIHGNSWHSYDSTIYNFGLCNYKQIIGGLLICSGVVLSLN